MPTRSIFIRLAVILVVLAILLSQFPLFSATLVSVPTLSLTPSPIHLLSFFSLLYFLSFFFTQALSDRVLPDGPSAGGPKAPEKASEGAASGYAQSRADVTYDRRRAGVRSFVRPFVRSSMLR